MERFAFSSFWALGWKFGYLQVFLTIYLGSKSRISYILSWKLSSPPGSWASKSRRCSRARWPCSIAVFQWAPVSSQPSAAWCWVSPLIWRSWFGDLRRAPSRRSRQTKAAQWLLWSSRRTIWRHPAPSFGSAVTPPHCSQTSKLRFWPPWRTYQSPCATNRSVNLDKPQDSEVCSPASAQDRAIHSVSPSSSEWFYQGPYHRTSSNWGHICQAWTSTLYPSAGSLWAQSMGGFRSQTWIWLGFHFV